MKKIYEANNKDKEIMINLDNDIRAYDLTGSKYIGIEDMMLIGRVKEFPENNEVDISWCLNCMVGEKTNGDIIIFEPLIEQIKNGNIPKLNAINTKFNEKIKLSRNAMILIPLDKYDNEIPHKRNVRLYEGEEQLAIKMLMSDKSYICIPADEDGYIWDEDERPDIIGFIASMESKQDELNKIFSSQEIHIEKQEEPQENIDRKRKIRLRKENEGKYTYKTITGLTQEVEGSIEIDDEMYATTDIGKIRENQEDAVLLMKDLKNPEFKMMVVADGMGGLSSGEIASHVIVDKLKDWFENLSDEQRMCYETGVEGLQESLKEKIENDIEESVQEETSYGGGSTLVCAIIGKNNTLIANIGDSRAYMVKNQKLIQISIEDTEAQANLERGRTPSKEAARFDQKSNIVLQCIGADRRYLVETHMQIIDNKDYDMILLFSDGVTDCLSDDDIAVVCRTSDKKEITKKVVEKAIKNDSLEPEELMDYCDLNPYIPGGKDNATAVAYVPKKDGEER